MGERRTELFAAEVINVHYKTKFVNTNKGEKSGWHYTESAYTVDIVPTGHRPPMSNVPVLQPNSLIYSPPQIGDRVICAYIEGLSYVPICIGTLYDPHGRSVLQNPIKNSRKVSQPDLLPDSALYQDKRDGSIFSKAYYPYDFVVQHQTGSYIRMRNTKLVSEVDEWGATKEPTENNSEITINNTLNGGSKTDTIVMKETSAGESTLTITHNTGTKIEIDKDGAMTIDASTQNITINGGTITLAGSTKVVVTGTTSINLGADGLTATSGVVNKNCACPITGTHMQGCAKVYSQLI